MIQKFGPLISRGIDLAIRAATGPAAKRMTIQAGTMATAHGVRKVAEVAEDKIDELEARGSISSKTASVATGAVRVARVSGEIAVSAVGSAAGSAIPDNGSAGMADAVRDTVKNPRATARTYVKNTADLEPGSWKWHRAMQGHTETARYLVDGKED